MAGKETSLSLVIKAVDKATAPLRALTVRLHRLTAPIAKWNERIAGLGKALAPLKPIGEAAGKFGGALRNVGSEVFNLGARIGALALGAGVAFFSIVKGAVDAGDKLGEMADRVGLGVDTYASLQFAAAQADVDQEQFNSAMDKFNKHLGEIKAGGGPFLAFLNKVSPALAREVKGAKSTEEALSLMTDAFKRIDDPAKSAILASEAFGKSGLQMGRFLHQGSAAIQEQQRRYLELTGSQEEFARNAGVLDNQMRETEVAFLGVRNAIAGALFPAVTGLGKALTDFLAKNREGLAAWAKKTGAAISAWVEGGGVDRLVAGFRQVADVVGRVLEFLGPTGTALAALGVLALPLVASLGSLAVAAVSLGIALAPFAALLPPILAVVGAIAGLAALGVTLYKNWDKISDVFTGFGDSLREGVLGAWDAIRPILARIAAIPGIGIPFRMGLANGDAMAGQVTQAIESRAGLAAGALAARPMYGPSANNGKAAISVSFDNLPRGAQVSVEPNSSQPVDMSMGYSSVLP